MERRVSQHHRLQKPPARRGAQVRNQAGAGHHHPRDDPVPVGQQDLACRHQRRRRRGQGDVQRAEQVAEPGDDDREHDGQDGGRDGGQQGRVDHSPEERVPDVCLFSDGGGQALEHAREVAGGLTGPDQAPVERAEVRWVGLQGGRERRALFDPAPKVGDDLPQTRVAGLPGQRVQGLHERRAARAAPASPAWIFVTYRPRRRSASPASASPPASMVSVTCWPDLSNARYVSFTVSVTPFPGAVQGRRRCG